MLGGDLAQSGALGPALENWGQLRTKRQVEVIHAKGNGVSAART